MIGCCWSISKGFTAKHDAGKNFTPAKAGRYLLNIVSSNRWTHLGKHLDVYGNIPWNLSLAHSQNKNCLTTILVGCGGYTSIQVITTGWTARNRVERVIHLRMTKKSCKSSHSRIKISHREYNTFLFKKYKKSIIFEISETIDFRGILVQM